MTPERSVYREFVAFEGGGDGSQIGRGPGLSDRRTPVWGSFGARSRKTPLQEQFFGVALALPSPSGAVCQKSETDHDESMGATDMQGDRGKISITSMRPCLHCGHWCNETPVSSS